MSRNPPDRSTDDGRTPRVRLEFVDRIRADLHAAVAAASWGHLLGRRRSDVQQILIHEIARIETAAFLLVQAGGQRNACIGLLAERTGLEPATPGVTGQYSKPTELPLRSGVVGVAGLEPATYGL